MKNRVSIFAALLIILATGATGLLGLAIYRLILDAPGCGVVDGAVNLR